MEQHIGSDLQSFEFIVPETFNGVRADHYLVQQLSGLSRSQIVAALKSGAVTVNGSPVKGGYLLRPGDVISGADVGSAPEAPPQPQPVDFEVIHEDGDIIVVAKPPGLVVHPGSGNPDNTLVNGLLHRYRELAPVGDEQRPGIVHRLDKDTSGLIIVARNRRSHRRLSEDFKQRSVRKTYLALVHGTMATEEGSVVEPIGRHPVNRQKMAVRPTGGKYSASRWRLRERFDGFSLVEVEIETGRTHQIRVHMAHIGHPVAGDLLYGPNRRNDQFNRQMLHAWRLSFNHPGTGEALTFEAELPPDFGETLDGLEKQPC